MKSQSKLTVEEKLAKKRAYYAANSVAILAHQKSQYPSKKSAKRAYNKAYCAANKEAVSDKQSAWYFTNKARILADRKAYYLKNKVKILACNAEWAAKNQERGRVAQRKRAKARTASDPKFRLTRNLRYRMWAALKGLPKADRTFGLLGCSIESLWEHLEKQFRPGMTRENYGPIWHVDHKQPCASFDLTNSEQQIRCFHYSNLQPLFAEENRKKWASYEGQ